MAVDGSAGRHQRAQSCRQCLPESALVILDGGVVCAAALGLEAVVGLGVEPEFPDELIPMVTRPLG